MAVKLGSTVKEAIDELNKRPKSLSIDDDGNIVVKDSHGATINTVKMTTKYYTKSDIDNMGIPLDSITELFEKGE